MLFQELIAYKDVDKDISKACVQKFQNHLWYLTPEHIALAFFDDKVPIDVKYQIKEALHREDDGFDQKRIYLSKEDVLNFHKKSMSDFASQKTLNFFDRFCLSKKFLDKEITQWHTDEDYLKAKELVDYLKVVNDLAERGVKLMEEYNGKLTKNENEKQYILQVVSEMRKLYPNINKQTLEQPFL